MRKMNLCLAVLMGFLAASSTITAMAAEGRAITLTAAEQAWLAAHPKIVVGGEQDWAPFDFVDQNGNYTGIAADYLKIIRETLGLEVAMVTGPSWDELLAMLRRKEIDVLPAIYYSEERASFANFTTPYIKIIEFIFSTGESQGLASFEGLRNKTTVVVKGYTIEGYMRANHPDFALVTAPTIRDALEKLVTGEADAFIGDLISTSYNLREFSFIGIKPIAQVPVRGPEVHMAVRKDWTVLRDLIDKTFKAIPVREHEAIKQRWIEVAEDKIEKSRPQIDLSAQESAWLAEHQPIRFTGDPDWLPQEAFTEEGQYIGIVADILDIIETRLGHRFERVPVKTWEEAVHLAETSGVDVLSETTNSERDGLTFTKPYLVFPVVIIAEQGAPSIEDPGALAGKRVAVVKDYGYLVPLRRQFGNLDYVEVETVRDGLMRLSTGDVDAFVSAAPTAYYQMSELGLTNLKVVGSAGLSLDLGFGVRKDMPALVSILNKALASITEEEKFNIREKWVPVIDTPAARPAAGVSYRRLTIYAVAVFLTVSLLAWILIRLLRRENIAVSFGSTWFRGLVLAGLSIFVLTVACLGWYMLERNKTERLRNVEEDLLGVLSVSEDRLALWLEERRAYLARLGRDPELVAITRRLLQVEPEKRALLASSALREARFFFQNSGDVINHRGFFLIDPAHVSIGAMRDANLGTRNLIAEQHPEIVQQAFEGQVRFVPPAPSDGVPGPSSQSDNLRQPPTMDFIGPVQDLDGRILAIMTLRMDPWPDWARVLNAIGYGKSREAYAFDRNGVMLTSSRFEGQLRRIGLLAKGQPSALNIEIRDPGGNLLEGFRPAVERSQQPLTHMAAQALALRQEMAGTGVRQGPPPLAADTKGYRDYRGVPVFGAWLWNADLDIGLAVEVDAAEALSHYYRTRTTIFSILGFTLFLSVAAILFVLVVGERTSRALVRARDDLEARVEARTAELQEKQTQLAEAEERARLLLDSAGEGIFGVDPEGRAVFINPAASRMLGYDPEELIGADVHARIHHSHADGSPYPKDECPMYLTHRDSSDHNIRDEVLWRRDGQPLPVEYTSMPIRKDGQVVGAVVTFRDITERRAMEEQLEATRSQLQHILDTSPIGVAFSTRGKIHFANPRFKEMFGAGVGDESPNLYVHPEDREALVRELKAEGKVENRDLQMYNRDHQVRDMLITYLPLVYDGEEGILGWLLDITDRKLVEKEIKEKYEELNRFHKIAIGRELKMIELKKEINALIAANGKPAKYKIH